MGTSQLLTEDQKFGHLKWCNFMLKKFDEGLIPPLPSLIIFCLSLVHVVQTMIIMVGRSRRLLLVQSRPRTQLRGVLLHHDNARPHTSAQTSDFLDNSGVQLVTHPPYSPDLAPYDFFFKLPKVKLLLKGIKFDTDDEALQAFINAVNSIPEDDWCKCFDNWFSRLKSCIGAKENPRTTLLELEQDTGISKTTIGRIVTEDLKLKKTPAKFIPRFLTNEQKLCRLATCEDMMEMTRTDPEWKDKIITGDETWVYGYDPETKPQSAEWRG
ncbi:hypothetical protein LAZ67_3004035 [Cordylochernes scorpioides]|uniref:Transposase n=1 Tax=Cordylochernes scorpioides TaxID=51811 RepID=A0ABY6KDQ0_9ARAC|nr:hypothetical protein LAZ67_3004035 [Cordylochernes scorpioides]